jgi:hypothetical protein
MVTTMPCRSARYGRTDRYGGDAAKVRSRHRAKANPALDNAVEGAAYTDYPRDFRVRADSSHSADPPFVV